MIKKVLKWVLATRALSRPSETKVLLRALSREPGAGKGIRKSPKIPP